MNAAESIQAPIREIENGREYDIGSYTVDMMRLYHHPTDTAWNARRSSTEEGEAREEDDERWRQSPPPDLQIT